MLLPSNRLHFEGREIAVEKLEEIGDDTDASALYRDRAGHFYAVFHNSERSYEECLHLLARERRAAGEYVTLPRDAAALDALAGTTARICRLSDRGALAWYLRKFINDGPLKKIMGEAVSAYIPRAERAGKVQLATWASRAFARELERTAKAAHVTAPEQLRLFAEDGVRRAKANAPAKPRRKAAPGAARAVPVQLELATTLVEVVRQFEAAPDGKRLAEAQRTVSALHQSLHATETFKRAVAI